MRFEVQFNKTDQRFNIKFNNLQQVTMVEAELYEGDYEVTPREASQTLATREKFMTDDVKIKAIPFFNVGNTSGGSTVFIGTLDADS